MTLEAFEKAKELIRKREYLLDAHEKINKWISNMNQPVWYGIKTANAHSSIRDIPIHPSEAEIKALLFAMRDRYDAEIAEIDKEIAAL